MEEALVSNFTEMAYRILEVATDDDIGPIQMTTD